MDRRQWLGWGAVGLGLLVIAYALVSGSSDEDRIREQLHALARTVSSPEPVTNLVFRASHLREGFGEVLAPEVQVSVPEAGRLPSDHRSLALATARVQSGFGAFQVELDGLTVEVDPGGAGRATARATALLTEGGGQGRSQQREVDFLLSKESGDWRVTRVAVARQE